MRRRRKPTLVPGDASSRAPTYAPGAARASVRAPIYSGRAASASSRRPRHSRAVAAASAGDRAAGPVARSVDDRNKAVCRVPGLYRAADIRAVGRAGPRRRVASRPYRRQRRSVRSRATTSVDSCRSSYISAEGGLTLACWSWGRVTGLVKPVTACHDGDASVALRGDSQPRESQKDAESGSGRAIPCLLFVPRLLGDRTRYLRLNQVKVTVSRRLPRFRLLFLCNRQDDDMKEWWDESLQKAAVKKSKKYVKTNTYNSSPLSLFLVLEKLISLFADRSPRVHP